MRAVNIRIGHDDDLVVAQVLDVEFGAHAAAQSLAQIVDFRVRVQLAGRCPQHVEDFTLKRQQRLRFASCLTLPQ